MQKMIQITLTVCCYVITLALPDQAVGHKGYWGYCSYSLLWLLSSWL